MLFNAFPLRERLVVKLCGLLGFRPGEAFGLTWADLRPEGLHIQRRVYRGTIDTPKSTKGKRLVALTTSVMEDIAEWRRVAPPGEWIFASENPQTPLWPTSFWWDKIRPTLLKLDMEWVNYQVLRRSAATLLNELGIDGQVVASQLGHGLDVSQNVYNKVGVARQLDAVNKLEAALQTTTVLKPKKQATSRKTANGILRNTGKTSEETAQA